MDPHERLRLLNLFRHLLAKWLWFETRRQKLFFDPPFGDRHLLQNRNRVCKRSPRLPCCVPSSRQRLHGFCHHFELIFFLFPKPSFCVPQVYSGSGGEINHDDAFYRMNTPESLQLSLNSVD